MTTTFKSSRHLVHARKNGFENLKPALFSPVTLLFLLALLFTFFLTASGRNGYNNSDREIIRTGLTKEEKNKASALRYERIVTSADPIRSILQ